MRRYSATEAARRFAALIDEAEAGPIVIENHGRERAALVSIRRYQIYEALVRCELDLMTAEKASGEPPLPGARARLRLKARNAAETGT
jgi:prevent-host-death family protein